jgi:hypothetical protein
MTCHNQLEAGLVAAEAPAPWGPHSVIGAFQPTNVSPFYGPAIVGSSVGTDGGRKK